MVVWFTASAAGTSPMTAFSQLIGFDPPPPGPTVTSKGVDQKLWRW